MKTYPKWLGLLVLFTIIIIIVSFISAIFKLFMPYSILLFGLSMLLFWICGELARKLGKDKFYD